VMVVTAKVQGMLDRQKEGLVAMRHATGLFSLTASLASGAPLLIAGGSSSKSSAALDWLRPRRRRDRLAVITPGNEP
jgi:hypothetical protein